MGNRRSRALARWVVTVLAALAVAAAFAMPASAGKGHGHGDARGKPAHAKAKRSHGKRHGYHRVRRDDRGRRQRGHVRHGSDRGHHRRGKPLTVMTRNLYLGGDIMRPLVALEAPPDRQLDVLIQANTELRAIVDLTSFPLRAQQLAREVKAHRPDLIGLQEVALWRHGPLGGAGDATVDYDFLQILLDALAARGEHYQVAHVQQESDVAAPAFFGGELRMVRLTMRDVVLERKRNGVRVLDAFGANYAARIPLEIAGQRLEFIRGYNVVDVKAGGREVRFVNTHLESVSSDVAYAQAAQLLAGPAAPDNGVPTILACDCNTDPLDTSRKPGETHAHQDPYLLITGPGGFFDAWLQVAPAATGFTSGLSELVNDTPAEAAARFDHRIDFIFDRRADGSPMPVDEAWVVGRDPDERTPPTAIGRLWPSDHAGVVARLRP